MEKILVATDFSVESDEVLPCIEDFAKAGIKQAVLVNVIDDGSMEGDMKEGVMDRLTTLCTTLEEKGISSSVSLRWGKPAEEISEAAENEQADLIVVFSKGRQYLRRTFIGSTSIKLVEKASCPVVIEKKKMRLSMDEQSVHFRKVLVPTDFSLASLEALAVLKTMREYIGEVLFVNVVEEKKADEKTLAYIKNNLEELVEEMSGFGLKAASFIRQGTASKEIIKLSKVKDASMVILPKIGGSVVKNILLGSTAQAVAIGVEIPVMMVPADLRR